MHPPKASRARGSSTKHADRSQTRAILLEMRLLLAVPVSMSSSVSNTVDGLRGLRLCSLCKPSPRTAPWDTVHGGQEHHAIQGNDQHGALVGCFTSVHASLWTQWSVHQAKTPYGQLVYHRCCLARRPAQRLDAERAARCQQSERCR